MGLLNRPLQRLIILAIGIGTIWLIVTQVFIRLDDGLPVFVALLLTYILSAYLILPQIIHLGVMILRRGRIPRVTRAADGLPSDPVNIILSGTMDELLSAFKAAGWHRAEKLTLRSNIKMVRCFILNRPYPEAPFSSLYLFGRKQDIGFQEPVGNSPRRRNHVRFWAANIDPRKNTTDISYWMKKHPVDPSTSHIWVGAATEDLGFGLTRLTYQLSHRIDRQVDQEREHIAAALRQAGQIQNEHVIDAGELVAGKYVSDGKILWAELGSQKEI